MSANLDKEAESWVKWIMTHAPRELKMKVAHEAKKILREESPGLFRQGATIIHATHQQKETLDLPMWGDY